MKNINPTLTVVFEAVNEVQYWVDVSVYIFPLNRSENINNGSW